MTRFEACGCLTSPHPRLSHFATFMPLRRSRLRRAETHRYQQLSPEVRRASRASASKLSGSAAEFRTETLAARRSSQPHRVVTGRRPAGRPAPAAAPGRARRRSPGRRARKPARGEPGTLVLRGEPGGLLQLGEAAVDVTPREEARPSASGSPPARARGAPPPRGRQGVRGSPLSRISKASSACASAWSAKRRTSSCSRARAPAGPRAQEQP